MLVLRRTLSHQQMKELYDQLELTKVSYSKQYRALYDKFCNLAKSTPAADGEMIVSHPSDKVKPFLQIEGVTDVLQDVLQTEGWVMGRGNKAAIFRTAVLSKARVKLDKLYSDKLYSEKKLGAAKQALRLSEVCGSTEYKALKEKMSYLIRNPPLSCSKDKGLVDVVLWKVVGNVAVGSVPQ